MTRDDIIRMAREAGFEADLAISNVWITDGYWAEELERFAALVAAAEREEVLDLVDAYAKNNTDLADAIRARSKT